MKKVIVSTIVALFCFTGISFAGNCEYDYECGQGMKCTGQFGNKYCAPK